MDALKTVGCEATAALTQQAIAALNLRPLTLEAIEKSILRRNAKRDKAFDTLDNRFYEIFEIEPKLFAFVETRPQAFVLRQTSIAPRKPKRGNENLIGLGVALMFAPKCDRTFQEVRKLTAEIAIQKEIQASESELDGAAYLFLFSSFLREGDLKGCEEFAEKAFELAREDTSHCVTQRAWVETLVERSNLSHADEVMSQYLEYLGGEDVTDDYIKNRVQFWADILRRYRTQLPRSRAYFLATFPDVSLVEPPAPRIQFPKPTNRRPPSSRKR